MNEELKNKIKFKIAMIEIFNEEENSNMKKLSYNKKSIIAACTLLILSTGFVFAKEFKNLVRNTFGLGAGIDTAVKNGYIENPEMNYILSTVDKNMSLSKDDGTILENINTSIKIGDFLMDDYNLSIDVDLLIDESIKNSINIGSDNNTRITLSDLIITDENNNILYSDCDEERFNKFCQEHNLNAKYHEFNEKYLDNGLNTYLNYIENYDNQYKISIKYNIYTATEFPKSKKLKLDFNKIRIENISENTENIENNVFTTLGNWNIELDVPEKMYNRSEEHYKVTSCENENFDVYTAKVSDTGFEIGITLKNTPRPTIPDQLYDKRSGLPGLAYTFNTKEEMLAVSKDKEFEEMYIEYHKLCNPVQVSNNVPLYNINWLEHVDGSWIENSKGEKFYCTLNPARKQNRNFINDTTFDFYETFGMTKADATNKLTFVINYYGEHYKIELEKVKK